MCAEQLAKLVALRLLHLTAEIRRRHPVCFVANDQVLIWRGLKFGLQFVGARGHVEAHD